jgi:hypothetical protein
MDEARAWACLMTNLLVLPGLGSLLGGRRIGWIQAALALVGFALSAFWLLWFAAALLREGGFPLDGGPYLPGGLTGVLLFAVSWIWGLLTGLSVLGETRDARRGRGGAGQPPIG